MGTKFGASALTFNEMWVHFLRVHLFSLFFYAQRYACTVYAIVVVVVVCVCVSHFGIVSKWLNMLLSCK